MKFRRHWILVLIVAGTVALVVMAGSLSSLDLRPAQRFSLSAGEKGSMDGSSLRIEPFLLDYMRLAVLVCGVILPFSIIYIIRSPQARRRVVLLLGFSLILIFFAPYLSRLNPNIHLPAINLQAPADLGSLIAIERPDTNPPAWLVLLVSLTVSSIIFGAGYFLWRFVHRREEPPLKQVAREARRALDELSAGSDLKDEVIRCYFEMARALSDRRGLKRRASMTTREFETYLVREGLPAGHVERLTRLFEKVRYGAKTLGQGEKREAVDCLKAIIRACEGAP